MGQVRHDWVVKLIELSRLDTMWRLDTIGQVNHDRMGWVGHGGLDWLRSGRLVTKGRIVHDYIWWIGGGYVGANLATQGKALAREAIRQFGFKAGDHAIVMVPIGDYARAQREDGARIVFEEHGMTVTVLDGDPKYASDPNMTIPIFGAALNANPDTKVIVHSGSDIMNVAEGIAKAAGYGPNEILQIGFDTSPQIMSAFEKGYVHLTSDQQPFSTNIEYTILRVIDNYWWYICHLETSWTINNSNKFSFRYNRILIILLLSKLSNRSYYSTKTSICINT